jgi:hypothetical protein
MDGDARTSEHMVRNKENKKGLFSYLDSPRIGEKEPVSDMVVMAVDFLKYQGEIAYETSKKQAIAITSTASTIGIGWSAFFFGIAMESWATSSIGLMIVFAGTYLLAFWSPRLVDKGREGLVDLGAMKFYNKWLSDSARTGAAEKRP